MNLEELGRARDSAEHSLPVRYEKTIGIVRAKRTGSPADDASPLGGDDALDGVIAHVRDIGWSLLVTYWDRVNPDACDMDALADKVYGILIDEEGVPASLRERLAARVPVVVIAGAPVGRDAGQPRRLLGKRACARLIEHIAVPGPAASVDLVPGELSATSACRPRR